MGTLRGAAPAKRGKSAQPGPENRKKVPSALLTMQQQAGNRAVATALAGLLGRSALQRQAIASELAGSAPALGEPPGQRLLRRGSQGDDVRAAQDRLNAHGAAPPLVPDGIFGPLTHRATVAFQNGHALTPDGVIGPRTSASLEGPTDVGGSSGQARTPPSGPQPGAVLRYDNTAYTITPPPPGTTKATLNSQIQAKQSSRPPDLGPTVTVTGVAVGSVAELFLWNVLVQLGLRSRWGTEVDLVTEIGRATTRPTRPAPIGRVTLRIDNQGNAAVSLVGTGPVVPGPSFPTREAAEAALRALGIANVVDGSRPWTLPELSKAHTALSQLPAADRSALDGVDLVRERTIVLNGRQMAGLFEHSSALAAGATTATRTDRLKIADLAFSGDRLSFIGDSAAAGPASFQTIVHEAGHAVETKRLRDARFARFQAMGDLNARITAMNAAITAFNASSGTAFRAARSYSRAQRGQAAAFLRSIDQATRALQAMTNNNAVARNAAREAAATRAIAARNAARAALATTAPAHPALTDFAAALADQDAWLVAARNRAAANAVVEQRLADERAATARGGGSRRLAAFVAVVNANNIPPLTQYAADNWPAHPDEFFAEAYSLWLNDRAYLQTNAPALVTFFDSGGHR